MPSKSFHSSRLLKTFLIGYQSTQRLVEICQRQFSRPSHGRSNFAHKPWIQKTQSPLPSSTRTTSNVQQGGSFSDGNKQGPSRTVVCPSNETCQYIYKCSHFQTLSPFDRGEHVKNLKLCFNCFGSHHVQHCNSKNVCRTANCGRKHHTLLHEKSGDNNQRVKPLNPFNYMEQDK